MQSFRLNRVCSTLGLGLLTVVLTFLYTLTSYSQEESEPDVNCREDADYVLLHVNGIYTSEDEAGKNNEQLSREMRGYLVFNHGKKVADKWSYRLAYNQTEGFLWDISETAIFSEHENYREKSWYSFSTGTVLEDPSFWRVAREVMKYGSSEKVLRWRKEEIEAYTLAQSDLIKHVNIYVNEYARGKKIILVPHSEGNFFANLSWELMTQTPNELFGDSIGIFGVGTPTSRILNPSFLNYGEPRYVTFYRDRAIDTARKHPALGFNPLPSNMEYCLSGLDLGYYATIRHSFIDDYLACPNSREAILSGAYSISQKLKDPIVTIPEGHDGIIAVTLNWGGEPDVDLHIYEPSGWHVYYGNPNGPNGSLDIDDTDGYGPEHYYAYCSTVPQAGIFKVGVNYYEGELPETAIIQVDAGSQTRLFRVPLDYANGSSGNQSPIMVAEVEVLGTHEDGYSFLIRDISGEDPPTPPDPPDESGSFRTDSGKRNVFVKEIKN